MSQPGAVRSRTCLLERPNCPNRARIVDPADQGAAGAVSPHMLTHRFKAGAITSLAVPKQHPRVVDVRQRFLDSHHRSCQSGPREQTGPRKLKKNDVIDLALPVLLRPTTQITASRQARGVVVRSEIARAGMGNMNGNYRNSGLDKLA